MRRGLLVLAVALALAGCTQATPTPTPTPTPTLTPTPSPTATPVPQLLRDAAEQAPFEIVIPSFLPHGMELTNADVIKPPAGMSEEDERANTQVVMRFANADDSAELVLFESIAVSSMGSSRAVPIAIGGVEGMMAEDEERGFLSLAWPGEGIGYLLTAFMTGTFTKDEVIRIAESTLIP